MTMSNAVNHEYEARAERQNDQRAFGSGDPLKDAVKSVLRSGDTVRIYTNGICAYREAKAPAPGFYIKCGCHWIGGTFISSSGVCVDPDRAWRFDTRAAAEQRAVKVLGGVTYEVVEVHP